MTSSLLIAALLAAAPASAAPRGCADHWKIELNRDSFAHNGAGRTFSDGQLAPFNAKLQIALRTAIAEACREGLVRASAAKAVRRLEILSASGATEPHIYAAGKATLHLEWVFAEENLAIPEKRDIRAGLACWTNPRRRACAGEGD
jgi:hypothetical protein